MKGGRAGAAGVTTELLERRFLRAGTLAVSIGDGVPRYARFTDPDGTVVVVSMRDARATLDFSGDNLSQSVNGAETLVNGSAITLARVAATGTGPRSALVMSGSGGDGRVVVGTVTADGPMKCIDGPPVVLAGTLSTGGPVRTLRLAGTQSATIQLGAGVGKSSITIVDAALDTDLVSGAPVARLDVGSWGGSDVEADAISAPSIAKANVRGTFIGNVSASSAGRLSFAIVQDTSINISSSLRSINAERGENILVTVGADIGSVSFKSLERARVYAGVAALPPEAPLPGTVADFIADSTIRRLWVSGATTTESVFAARFIRKAIVARVPREFGPSTFVVADHISRLTGSVLNLRTLVPIHEKALEDEVHTFGGVEVRAI